MDRSGVLSDPVFKFAHRENWYALFISITKPCSADDAMIYMGVRATNERASQPINARAKPIAKLVYVLHQCCGLPKTRIGRMLGVEYWVVTRALELVKKKGDKSGELRTDNDS